MLACNCAAKFDESGSILNTIFPVVILGIGAATIGLVVTIHKECENARRITPVLITISALTTFGSIGYLGMKIYEKVKKTDAEPALSPQGSSEGSNSPVSLLGG